MARPLRPLVLAGYGGVGGDARRRASSAASSGCSAGSSRRSCSRSCSTSSRRRARLRRWRSARRCSARVDRVRARLPAAPARLPVHGRLVVVHGRASRSGPATRARTSSVALVGRHKFSPAHLARRRRGRASSRDRGGDLRRVRRAVRRSATFLSIPESSCSASSSRSPPRSAICSSRRSSATCEVKDSGPPARRSRRRARPRRRVPLRASRRVLHRGGPAPRLTSVKKRIAVLGATGSIGRQTLDVIDADPRARARRRRVRHRRRSTTCDAPLTAGRRRPGRAARAGRAGRRR